jgi:hypothetical protein
MTYVDSGVIVMTALYLASSSLFQLGWQIEAGYSMTTGAQLWITNRTETPNTRLYVQSGTLTTAGNGVYIEENLNTFVVTGYSMTTGTQLWTNTLPNPNPYDADLMNGMVANGVLYMAGLGGDVYAFNVLTGTFLWHYSTGTAGYNTPYGIWPIWDQGLNGFSIAGGLLFVAEGHEYSPPLFLGASQLALNLTNGNPVWSIEAFDVNDATAISDGIMTTLNAYDAQIYAYGQGPSKTTVTAPDIDVTTSKPVTITGTVMDISAGSLQNAVAANFPNGLPCVSDASMTQWMEYIYEQQPEPTNVTGVPITLTAIDPNNNHVTIGTTTSNSLGTYAFTWTPQIEGNYTILATFAGTGSYYGSSADTYVYASSPPATPAPTSTPVSGLATMSGLTIGIVAAVIAIIIAIAIVGLLLLRKKP